MSKYFVFAKGNASNFGLEALAGQFDLLINAIDFCWEELPSAGLYQIGFLYGGDLQLWLTGTMNRDRRIQWVSHHVIASQLKKILDFEALKDHHEFLGVFKS